jgi:hypothetical protein
MLANDEVDIEPQCVEAARALGYVEDIGPEPPARAGRRARRTTVKPPAEMTRQELIEVAEERGVDLPAGYVAKAELVELVEKADEEDHG